MSPAENVARYFASGFPRVSGDEPTLHMFSVSSARFSPRERG